MSTKSLKTYQAVAQDAYDFGLPFAKDIPVDIKEGEYYGKLIGYAMGVERNVAEHFKTDILQIQFADIEIALPYHKMPGHGIAVKRKSTVRDHLFYQIASAYTDGNDYRYIGIKISGETDLSGGLYKQLLTANKQEDTRVLLLRVRRILENEDRYRREKLMDKLASDYVYTTPYDKITKIEVQNFVKELKRLTGYGQNPADVNPPNNNNNNTIQDDDSNEEGTESEEEQQQQVSDDEQKQKKEANEVRKAYKELKKQKKEYEKKLEDEKVYYKQMLEAEQRKRAEEEEARLNELKLKQEEIQKKVHVERENARIKREQEQKRMAERQQKEKDRHESERKAIEQKEKKDREEQAKLKKEKLEKIAEDAQRLQSTAEQANNEKLKSLISQQSNEILELANQNSEMRIFIQEQSQSIDHFKNSVIHYDEANHIWRSGGGYTGDHLDYYLINYRDWDNLQTYIVEMTNIMVHLSGRDGEALGIIVGTGRKAPTDLYELTEDQLTTLGLGQKGIFDWLSKKIFGSKDPAKLLQGRVSMGNNIIHRMNYERLADENPNGPYQYTVKFSRNGEVYSEAIISGISLTPTSLGENDGGSSFLLDFRNPDSYQIHFTKALEQGKNMIYTSGVFQLEKMKDGKPVSRTYTYSLNIPEEQRIYGVECVFGKESTGSIYTTYRGAEFQQLDMIVLKNSGFKPVAAATTTTTIKSEIIPEVLGKELVLEEEESVSNVAEPERVVLESPEIITMEKLPLGEEENTVFTIPSIMEMKRELSENTTTPSSTTVNSVISPIEIDSDKWSNI